MLQDVIAIADMDRVLRGNEPQVGGFDLIYDGDFVKNDKGLMSLLGCNNDRLDNLAKLKASILKQGGDLGSVLPLLNAPPPRRVPAKSRGET